jgi:PKD repeat protein
VQYRWYINGVRQTDQTTSSFSYTFDTAGTQTVSLLVLNGGALGGYGESIAITPVYRVGDFGPAGGYVFYDDEIGYDLDGDGTIESGEKHLLGDGKRYLEAAPAGWSGVADDPGYVFGYYRPQGTNLVVSTGTDIGSGKGNTEALVTAMGSAAYSSSSGSTTKAEYAAKMCADYRGGGHADWFLPSKDELDLMHQNLYLQNLGDFSSNLYWSSSEYYLGYSVWNQYFETGTQGFNYRHDVDRVRPVRAF